MISSFLSCCTASSSSRAFNCSFASSSSSFVFTLRPRKPQSSIVDPGDAFIQEHKNTVSLLRSPRFLGLRGDSPPPPRAVKEQKRLLLDPLAVQSHFSSIRPKNPALSPSAPTFLLCSVLPYFFELVGRTAVSHHLV